MQQYYFSLHDTTQQLFLHREPAAEAEFIWLDYTREDVRQHPEQWQQQVFQHTQLWLNEYHLRDILNLEHPCNFDSLEDYDLLIFHMLKCHIFL